MYMCVHVCTCVYMRVLVCTCVYMCIYTVKNAVYRNTPGEQYFHVSMVTCVYMFTLCMCSHDIVYTGYYAGDTCMYMIINVTVSTHAT